MLPAMRKHVEGSITVCVPQLMAIVLSRFMSPSRMVGVVIQAFFLIVFQVVLYLFLMVHQRLSAGLAFLGTVFFLGAGCILFPVGGLSDFRMDLLLWLNFSTTVLLLLLALKLQKETQRLRWFLFAIAGLAAAVTCLCRATAPVYLLGALLPVVAFELMFATSARKRIFAGALVSAVVAAVGCLWFYFLNYEHLRFYYVVWNTDANAGLTYWDSFEHIRFVRKAIGTPLLIFIAVAWLVTASGYGSIARKELVKLHRGWGWDYAVFAWLGVAPIAMLVAKRAGLNPFVSMPACLGVLLLCIVPLLRMTAARPGRDRALFTFSILVALLASMLVGKYQHERSKFNSMAGQRKVLDRMVEYSKSGEEINFSATTLAELNTSSLMSMLLFDVEAETRRLDVVQWQERRFRPQRLFLVAADADWAQIEGDSIEDKLESLFLKSCEALQFVIVPDETAAKRLSEKTRNRVINGYANEIRKRFVESSTWEQVGDPIEASQGLNFLVMKKVQR